MLKIRLSRVGKRNSPIFRLVVAEKSRAVKRENIEILGLYNPISQENKFQANKERVLYWIDKGAQPSNTVQNLLCDFGYLPKNQKIKITFGKPMKKKEMKAKKAEKPETPATNGTAKAADDIKEIGKEEIEDKTPKPEVEEKSEKPKEKEKNKNVEEKAEKPSKSEDKKSES